MMDTVLWVPEVKRETPFSANSLIPQPSVWPLKKGTLPLLPKLFNLIPSSPAEQFPQLNLTEVQDFHLTGLA